MRRFSVVAMGIAAAAMSIAIIGAVAGAGAQACSSTQAGPVGGVPGQLVPLFQGAAARYKLGPEGAAILAAINYVESDFDQSNLPGVHSGANSAGAEGPMQFLAGTWQMAGVNAPGDPPGQPPNVYDEADAVYSAAHYLAMNGLTANPASWQNAIWQYNHAGWYVSEVLAHAHTYYTQGLASGSATPVSWPGAQTCAVNATGYVNPFARATNLVPQRIDMGVDYDGDGPILALGRAQVTFAGPDPGWAGGSSVNYTLLDGPYAGRSVYVAEAVVPTVSAGTTVPAGSQIATFGHGFSTNSIETGWASGPGRPVAKAAALGQQATSGDPGNNRTWCGNNFSQLLAQLGAPAGLTGAKQIVGSGC